MRLRVSGLAALAAAGLLVACGAATDSAGLGAGKASPLPPAEDRPEPDQAISGRFPVANQLEEAATGGQGYRKGLRLVGSNPILYPGHNVPRGQNFQLGWMGGCAYVGTADLTQFVAHRVYMTPLLATAADQATGMAVIDASDPTAPELVQIIPNPEVAVDAENPDTIPDELAQAAGQLPAYPNTHRAMAMSWFAITSHEGRRVLVAGAHTLLALFDATDCRNPVLKSTLSLHHDNVAVHGLRLSKDGMRLYVSGVLTFDAMAVIDISDLTSPRVMKVWEHGAHDVELNADETRMYMNSLTGPGQRKNPDPNEGDSDITGGGLRVVDITGITACSGGHSGHHGEALPAPAECKVEFKEIAEYEWLGLSHATRVGRIKGRPYAFTVDEYSSDDNNCDRGWVRIIDLTNEADPQQAGELRLGVSKPENCFTTQIDQLTYSSHYIELDDPNDTKLVFAAWYASGLRVFDVRDPEIPLEIAYLMPPASSQTVYQSNFAKPTADSTISHIRWRKEKNELWVVNVNGGFTILQFTDSAQLPPGYFP